MGCLSVVTSFCYSYKTEFICIYWYIAMYRRREGKDIVLKMKTRE